MDEAAAFLLKSVVYAYMPQRRVFHAATAALAVCAIGVTITAIAQSNNCNMWWSKCEVAAVSDSCVVVGGRVDAWRGCVYDGAGPPQPCAVAQSNWTVGTLTARWALLDEASFGYVSDPAPAIRQAQAWLELMRPPGFRVDICEYVGVRMSLSLCADGRKAACAVSDAAYWAVPVLLMLAFGAQVWRCYAFKE